MLVKTFEMMISLMRTPEKDQMQKKYLKVFY
jgi:hypothetical protein